MQEDMKSEIESIVKRQGKRANRSPERPNRVGQHASGPCPETNPDARRTGQNRPATSRSPITRTPDRSTHAHPSADKRRMPTSPIVVFSPKGGCTALLVAAVGNARKSIAGLIYEFNHPKIADALSIAAKRGVNVKIVFDASAAEKEPRIIAVLRRWHRAFF